MASETLKPNVPPTQPGATIPLKPAAAVALGKPTAALPGAKPGAAGANPDEPETEGYRLGFWQQKWVQDVIPLATSLAIHLGLVLLAVATYKTVEKVVTVIREQIMIPDAAMVDTGNDIGGIPNPGLGGDPTRPAAQNQFENVPADSTGWADKESKDLAGLVGGGQGENAGDSVIGIGSNAAFGKGGGLGTGVGGGRGSGVRDGGGPLAPFGVPGGGGGVGPKSNFMGSGGNAMTVAFVCDASGSMLGQQFDLLKEEIKKAVGNLKPIQGYDIVFFQNQTCAALSTAIKNPGLVMANTENKRRTFEFVNSIMTGPDSDPIPGIKHAMRQRPQLMYLLTDGAFDNNEEVIKTIKQLNGDGAVRINTIAFFRNDQKESDKKLCEDVLKKIATENKGSFKVVLTSELVR